MNGWDIFLVILVAAVFALAVRKWIRDRRRGGCGCGCCDGRGGVCAACRGGDKKT